MNTLGRLIRTAVVAAAAAGLQGAATRDLHAPGLPLGRISRGVTTTGDVASYQFRAESAGILTVVIRSTDETDLVLAATDADGQNLPDARSDQDLGGDAGAEQFAVTVPREGTYYIRVEPFGSGTASFLIGASWLGFPELEQPADPDGAPSTAKTIAIGQAPLNDMLDPSSGDYWDWFALRADRAGMLTVAIRAAEGDLVLEAFNAGEYTAAIERSDQDLQEVTGNEALTLSVTPGQIMYFKVSTFGSGGSAMVYRLSLGFIPY